MQQHNDNNKNTRQDVAVLPKERTAAMRMITGIVRSLLEFAEREERSLLQNDFILLASIQEEKESLATRYEQVCAEFSPRIEEFRGINTALLDQLEALQNSLGEKTQANNALLEEIYRRSRTKTQDTLLAAQEIAQDHYIRYEDKEEAQS